jgi:hypothetical protein
MTRRGSGSETANRLRDWDQGQTAAERLAGRILLAEGFQNVDPIHPLGGPDRLRDLICVRDGIKWTAAAYFPHGQKTFPAVRRKFRGDIGGITSTEAKGFAFITNQYLRDAERASLNREGIAVEIYHRERIAMLLDSPGMYGTRLEFLDIEMTKDEQVAFVASFTALLTEVQLAARGLLPLLPLAEALQSSDQKALEKLKSAIPLQQLREFASTLQSITGGGTGGLLLTAFGPTIDRLRVPLHELREFRNILYSLTSNRFNAYITGAPINKLTVPISALREFDERLDAVLAKLERVKQESRDIPSP